MSTPIPQRVDGQMAARRIRRRLRICSSTLRSHRAPAASREEIVVLVLLF